MLQEEYALQRLKEQKNQEQLQCSNLKSKIVDQSSRYTEKSNFDNYDVNDLADILLYGDHRAGRRGDHKDYDFSLSYVTNPATDQRIPNNSPLDKNYRIINSLQAANIMGIGGTVSKIDKPDCKSDSQKELEEHLEIFLGIRNGQYAALLKNFEKNIKELLIAKRKNNGVKSTVQLIAACIVKNGALEDIDVSPQDIEYQVLRLGSQLIALSDNQKIVEGYREFDRDEFNFFLDHALEMKFYKHKKHHYCCQSGLYEKYNKRGMNERRLNISDRIIAICAGKASAKRIIAELYNKGVISESLPIIELIDELDHHYQDFFKIYQNMSIVTAVVAVRLFHKELKRTTIINHILEIEELSEEMGLRTKILCQSRMKEQKTKCKYGIETLEYHVKNEIIRKLYNDPTIESNNEYFDTTCEIDEDPVVPGITIFSFEYAPLSIVVNYPIYYMADINRHNIGQPKNLKRLYSIIVRKYNYPITNFQTYELEEVISPVVTKTNHISFFNKKDG